MQNNISPLCVPRLSNRINNPSGDLCRKAAKTFSYIGEGFVDKSVIPFYDAQAVFDIPNFAAQFIDEYDVPNNFYTNVSGDDYLLNVLSIKGKTSGLSYCNKENILITAGAVNAFSGLCYALCDAGDVILTLSPSYILFANAPETYGAELVLVPSEKQGNKFTVQPEVLEQYILKTQAQGKRIKALLIVNPTNIDGQCWNQNEIDRIVPIIKKHNILVIEDRVYDETQYDDVGTLTFFGETKEIKDQVITIDSVSKRYGATQWRIGWVYGPKDIIDASTQYLTQSVWSPNLKFQRAAALMIAASFNDDEFSELKLYAHDSDFIKKAISSRNEIQKYFRNLRYEYRLRRDMCLYIINGKDEYDKLQGKHSFLMSSDEIFNSLNVDLVDFDISSNGIKGFGTPIIPVAAMFLLIEAGQCVFDAFKSDQVDQDLLLARIFYKEIQVVMLPPSELTLPDEHMFFRMEFGIDINLLLQGLSKLQKFMERWFSMADIEIKRILQNSKL